MTAAASAGASRPSRSWAVDELRAARQRVPAAAGVYTFFGSAGEPLYVGKSIDLRRRLAGYLAAAPRGRKTARLMRVAQRVEIERTGSEFAALLREVDLVQALRPPFNRRMAAPEGYVYLALEYAGGFPRVSVTATPTDAAQYLGPYMQQKRLAATVDALNDAFRMRTCDPLPLGDPCWRRQTRRCLAPCIDAVDPGEYGRNFLVVREALCGRSGEAIRRLAARRDEHAAAERFESAAALQRRIAAIERMRRVLYASHVPPLDAFVVQAALAAGAVDLWAIGDGEVRFTGSGAADALAPLFDRAWAALRGARRAPAPIDKSELDRRCIIRQWLRSRHAAGVAAPASASLERAEVWRRVADLARRHVAGLI